MTMNYVETNRFDLPDRFDLLDRFEEVKTIPLVAGMAVLPPPPWAAVRQPARARLAAAGAAQTEGRP